MTLPRRSNDSQLVKPGDLVDGDLVDLEGDAFSDPDHADMSFPYECERVIGVEQETPACVRVDYENHCCGYPTDHLLRRIIL